MGADTCAMYLVNNETLLNEQERLAYHARRRLDSVVSQPAHQPHEDMRDLHRGWRLIRRDDRKRVGAREGGVDLDPFPLVAGLVIGTLTMVESCGVA